MVQPRVCLSETPYAPPDWPSQLQWCDLHRGAEEGGQILAAFELIEVSETVGSGAEEGGQILAAFELIEVSETVGSGVEEGGQILAAFELIEVGETVGSGGRGGRTDTGSLRTHRG